MTNNYKTKQIDKIEKGGNAGEIYIAARKIIGNGLITADGGDGNIGGKGGRVTIISEDNQFSGKVSAQGGKNIGDRKKWWEATWFQIIALIAATLGIVGFILLIV